MNGKQAKAIRKAAGFQPHAARSYKTTPVKTVFVDTGRTGTDGKPVMQPQVRSLVVATGIRSSYQKLKRHAF